MIISCLYVILGLIVLLISGDMLVRAAVNLSLRLGISALIISLTVVAFGTSAPELLIAIKAVIDNAPAIALGNVVGSNIANILMVIGVPALLSAAPICAQDSQKSYIYMLLTTAFFIMLCFIGPFTPLYGFSLLTILAAILFSQFRQAQKNYTLSSHPGEAERTLDEADPQMPGWKISIYFIIGIVGLPLGAHVLVEGAEHIASYWGMSDAAVGLTIIALGTSSPELATGVMAVYRRHTDVIIGNVIGSNIFNLLAIIGVASFFGNIPVDRNFLTFDLWVMFASSMFLLPFAVFGMKINKLWGMLFSTLYAIYIYVSIVYANPF